MKTISSIFLLIISFTSFAQTKDDCNCSFLPTGSMSIGWSKHGIIATVEGGVWGLKNNIGIFAGIMSYDGKTVPNDKVTVVGTSMIKELFVRPTLKLDHNGVKNFHHAITSFIGTKGNYGGSYRAYYQVGDYVLIGLEPFISSKNGPGGNVILTVSL